MTILLDDEHIERAFPHRMEEDFAIDRKVVNSGMTLRDYFAAHAPWARAHFLAEPTDEGVERVAARMAKRAYAFADAMLEARKK